jgi:hypothetical protein
MNVNRQSKLLKFAPAWMKGPFKSVLLVTRRETKSVRNQRQPTCAQNHRLINRENRSHTAHYISGPVRKSSKNLQLCTRTKRYNLVNPHRGRNLPVTPRVIWQDQLSVS